MYSGKIAVPPGGGGIVVTTRTTLMDLANLVILNVKFSFVKLIKYDINPVRLEANSKCEKIIINICFIVRPFIEYY
jgi:hypothetical protein